MTLDEFVKEYEGKKIDYDGSYGAQCVDLVRLYIQLVWGLPQPKSVISAYEAYTRWLRCGDGFNEISWKSITKIARGDIIVFPPTNTNSHGHIAIVLDVTGDEVLCFEQNGFTQKGAEQKRRLLDMGFGCLTLSEKKKRSLENE